MGTFRQTFAHFILVVERLDIVDNHRKLCKSRAEGWDGYFLLEYAEGERVQQLLDDGEMILNAKRVPSQAIVTAWFLILEDYLKHVTLIPYMQKEMMLWLKRYNKDWGLKLDVKKALEERGL